MSYGFEIINTGGNVVITDGFKALRYYMTIYPPYPFDNSNPFPVTPGYTYIGVCAEKNQDIMGQVGDLVPPSPNYKAYRNYGSYSGPVHVYTDAPVASPSGYGLELYAANGSKIFDSDEQGLDVLTNIVIPVLPVDSNYTYFTVPNPNNYDIAVTNPHGNLGRYAASDNEYYLTVRIVSNTQIAVSWSWVLPCKGCGNDDQRHITVLPIFRKPII